jgi:hypothetical protein
VYHTSNPTITVAHRMLSTRITSSHVFNYITN